MRNVKGDKILLKLLEEDKGLLMGFLECTEAQKFNDFSDGEVVFSKVELVEFLSDDYYNFKFRAQWNQMKEPQEVYISVIGADTLPDNTIVKEMLQSAYGIVDHQWKERSDNEGGMSGNKLWCTMYMVYSSDFDEIVNMASNERTGMVLEEVLKFSLDQQWNGDEKEENKMQQAYYVVFLLIKNKKDYERCKEAIQILQFNE